MRIAQGSAYIKWYLTVVICDTQRTDKTMAKNKKEHTMIYNTLQCHLKIQLHEHRFKSELNSDYPKRLRIITTGRNKTFC